jgi:acrylyl-CoA reductase (NADPH)
MFDAILIAKDGEQQVVRLTQVDESQLPEGDVEVAVAYSTLNYKDALAITGASPVVRSFPMVPGIDFAGVVTASTHADYKPGDRVILNGWGVGEKHWGGCRSARVSLVTGWFRFPRDFLRQAMAIGTAGYTAMLCIDALERYGLTPDAGEIAVSGAAGGVGSIATILLAARGYSVAAITAGRRKPIICASLVLRRSSIVANCPERSVRWRKSAGQAQSMSLAARFLPTCSPRSAMAALAYAAWSGGWHGSSRNCRALHSSRVSLLGVDSVMAPRSKRLAAWAGLARDLDMDRLAKMTNEIALADVIGTAPDFLAGKVRGRIVVPVAPDLG